MREFSSAAKRLPEVKKRGFVKIVENCSRVKLMPKIQGKILEKSVVYTDGWKGYDGNEFVLHLKECQFRYNHRDEDLLPIVKKSKFIIPTLVYASKICRGRT